MDKIYSNSYRVFLREKFQLKEIGLDWADHDDVIFYLQRNLVAGINGPTYEHKTTGPCLLPTVDINLLKSKNIDVQAILDRQPTIQNVLLVATASKGQVHVCLETKEFSTLLADLTGENQEFLDETIEIARRTMEINKRLLNWWGIRDRNIHLHFTHEPRVDETIQINCRRYGELYLRYLESYPQKSNNFRLGQRMRKLIARGKKLEDIYRLRIYSTYFPGWWGDEKVKEHSIVENVFHDAQLFTKKHSKSSMVGLMPPKDLNFKKNEMDVGVPLYLGTEEKIREGIELLKMTRFPNKNRFNCIVGNLLLYAVKNIEDFHCIESCGRNQVTCHHDCRACLDILEDFILTISGL
ncbi:MAG: hypothetical protein ACTSSI_13795 [Candidatus Helarchaeota archaeon]